QEKQRVKTLQEDSDKLKQQLKSTEDKLKEYKKQIDTLLLEQELVNLYENGGLRESVDQYMLDTLRRKINQLETEQKAQLVEKWKQAQTAFLKNLIQNVEFIDDVLHITFKNDDYQGYTINLYRNGWRFDRLLSAKTSFTPFNKEKRVWKAACQSILDNNMEKKCTRVPKDEKDYNFWISPRENYYIEVIRYKPGFERYIIYTKGDPLNSTQKENEKDQSEIQMDQLQGGPENLKQQLEMKDEQIQKLEQEKQKLETQMDQLQGGPENLKQQLEM
ncbi:TPA: hypothetical protein QCX08_004288, partial [Bacillus cytotoxicus]|nr:hypothetical protein [Bacillus cytotoxicus]